MEANITENHPLMETLSSSKKALLDNNHEYALKILRNIDYEFENNPNEQLEAEAYLNRGKSLLLQRKFSEAAEAFQTSFRRPSLCPEGGVWYGKLLLADKDADKAGAIFQKVLEVAPGHPEALYQKGACELQLKKQSQALESFEKSLSIAPQYPAAKVARFFAKYLKQGEPIRQRGSSSALHLVPITPFMADWLGGQNYITNALKSLDTLKEGKKPRLILVVLIDDWLKSNRILEIVKIAAKMKSIYAIFDADMCSVYLSPAAFRYRRNWQKLAPNVGCWKSNLLARVSSTFPMMYPNWGLGEIGNPIFWVPDLQHNFLPENFSLEERLSRTLDIGALAMGDNRVLFSSFDALSHFEQLYPGTKRATCVWHFCSTILPSEVDPQLGGEQYDILPEKFYYVANQFWRHKNHEVVFRAMKILAERGLFVHVVLSGADLEASAETYHLEMKGIIGELDVGTRITSMGTLSRVVQLNVLRRSCAVIQPSKFEGWSTVIEDARSFGIPILAAALPVNIEQLGESGFYFDQDNPYNLANLIQRVDPDLAAGPISENEVLAEAASLRRIKSSAMVLKRILSNE